jgi:hypothetical protein
MTRWRFLFNLGAQCLHEQRTDPVYTFSPLTFLFLAAHLLLLLSLSLSTVRIFRPLSGNCFKDQNLAKVKKNEFLLQKDFLLEAKHVEFKMANPLKDEVVRGEEEKIQVIKKKTSILHPSGRNQ